MNIKISLSALVCLLAKNKVRFIVEYSSEFGEEVLVFLVDKNATSETCYKMKHNYEIITGINKDRAAKSTNGVKVLLHYSIKDQYIIGCNVDACILIDSFIDKTKKSQTVTV